MKSFLFEFCKSDKYKGGLCRSVLIPLKPGILPGSSLLVQLERTHTEVTFFVRIKYLIL